MPTPHRRLRQKPSTFGTRLRARGALAAVLLPPVFAGCSSDAATGDVPETVASTESAWTLGDGISPLPPRLPPGTLPDIDLSDFAERAPGVAVVSSAPGRLDVFARGKTGALLWKRIEGARETPWESLGGDITSDPAAVSLGSGRMDVFARGRLGELAHIAFNGAWGEWESLGSALRGAPAATSPAPGRIDVFVRNARDRLMRRTFQSNAWQGWQSFGLVITSDPAVVSPSSGRVDVFAKGDDAALLHGTFTTTSPTSWTNLGGTLTSAPTAATTGAGRIAVFARGTRGVLVHRSWSGSAWSPWEDLGGRISSSPDALGSGTGRIDVFARGAEERLEHRVFTGTEWEAPRVLGTIAHEPAWGVADLHAHPATHLSFGATEAENGLFWGKPGLAWDPSGASVTRDLPPCAKDKHSGSTGDIVKHKTRLKMIATLDELTGHPHASGSDGQYANWPHALSVSHQQMHVSFLRRAFEGGVRLMFASVTNNQTLSMLWHRNYDGDGGEAELPSSGPTDDYESARKQLAFIRDLAAANPGWMRVVTTPRAARQAVLDNRIALVLSLELDKLTPDQILALQREFGVGIVTPIHLADNEFGGAAVYSDVFNTSNWYLNRVFHSVRGNPFLRFRLSWPEYLHAHEWDVLQAGAVEPKRIDRAAYCGLGYEPCTDLGLPGVPKSEGHENARGLNEAAVERLMRAGLMVDVSHMGAQATSEALGLAERFGYPLVATHGGVRRDGQRAESERNLLFSHAERISTLGGVFGVGTEGGVKGKTVVYEEAGPLFRFRGDNRSWTRTLRTTAPLDQRTTGLRVTIRTGGDDLRGGNDNARAVVRYRVASGGTMQARTTVVPLNGTAKWDEGTTNTVWVPLPDMPQASHIDSFSIETSFGGGIGGDNWDVSHLNVDYEAGGDYFDLLHRQGDPFFRFTGDRRVWTQSFFREQPWDAELASLTMTVRTGEDNLRGENDNAYATVALTDGQRIETPINEGRELTNGSTKTVTLALPAGTRLRDIASVRVRATLDGGSPFMDNWNLDEVTLAFTTTSGVRGTLERRMGAPYHRFTGGNKGKTVYARAPEPPPPETEATLVRVSFRTGNDDLRADGQAHFVLGLRSGLTTGPVPINQGGQFNEGSTFHRVVALPAGTRVQDLAWIRIDHDGNRPGMDYDNWNLDELKVEVLPDPVTQWIGSYNEVSDAALGVGVALGTDLNGFAPQLAFTTRTMPATITAARDRAPSWARPTTPALGPHRLGASRVFDFQRDGIAHYGMLPDFFQALATTPEGAAVVDRLFRSTEDTIRAWERALAARARVMGSR